MHLGPRAKRRLKPKGAKIRRDSRKKAQKKVGRKSRRALDAAIFNSSSAPDLSRGVWPEKARNFPEPRLAFTG